MRARWPATAATTTLVDFAPRLQRAIETVCADMLATVGFYQEKLRLRGEHNREFVLSHALEPSSAAESRATLNEISG